jgi:hypothetical protein
MRGSTFRRREPDRQLLRCLPRGRSHRRKPPDRIPHTFTAMHVDHPWCDSILGVPASPLLLVPMKSAAAHHRLPAIASAKSIYSAAYLNYTGGWDSIAGRDSHLRLLSQLFDYPLCGHDRRSPTVQKGISTRPADLIEQSRERTGRCDR